MSDHIDNVDDVVDDVDDTQTETVDDVWVSPSQEDYEKLLADKKKASYEASTRKKYLRAHGIDPRTGEKLANGTEGTTDADETVSKPTVDIASVEKIAAQKLDAIYAALDEANVDPKSRQVVLKLIDRSAITVDTEGVEGIEEQIAALKDQAPALFKRAYTKAPGAGEVDPGKTKAPPASENLTYTEKLIAQFHGK